MVSRRVLLTSRWGYYLQIDEQQNICGARTKDKDEYCVLEMKTIDFTKVTIRGVKTNVYIAINAQGHLYTTDSENPSVYGRRFIIATAITTMSRTNMTGFTWRSNGKVLRRTAARQAWGKLRVVFSCNW
ncbi:Fibroblast growth factor 6 [Desmophyllum pertusum]|uniref:Fibroblast growth factor 6 n=1 Tax=Desmophyllum pertusum TaxID=174260 RepID=A0A9X0D511_9CNID|nr:Fibroblast growth factor 6 [Desmophyllum pertusum]